MKLVSFFSVKGGAGKTTGLMAAVSGLRRKGLRVALLEGDKNDPLKFWNENAHQNKTWDKDCKIFEAASVEEMQASYAEAQRAGYDLALLDAEGGETDLNTTGIVSSDLVIIPLSLSALDIEYGIQSYQFAQEILQANGREIPMAFLICRFPASARKLTKADRESFDMLRKLPQVSTRLPTRAAYADMAAAGMLHLYYNGLMKDPALRVTSFAVGAALQEADGLATDITDAIEMELAHADS